MELRERDKSVKIAPRIAVENGYVKLLSNDLINEGLVITLK